jgi:hypothetical protein
MSFSVHARDWNLRFKPVQLLIGAGNIEVGYALTENFSLAAGGMLWNVSLLDVDFEVTEMHVRGDYWFSGAFNDSWYFSGYISSMSLGMETIENSKNYSGDISATGFGIAAGYHWQWDNFNMELGVTWGSYSFDSKLELEASDNTTIEEDVPPSVTGGGLEFNMGFAF